MATWSWVERSGTCGPQDSTETSVPPVFSGDCTGPGAVETADMCSWDLDASCGLSEGRRVRFRGTLSQTGDLARYEGPIDVVVTDAAGAELCRSTYDTVLAP